MNINTTRFGNIEVSEDQIISMTRGLIGFPEHHDFVIVHAQQGSILYWYQSVDDSELAFVITSPLAFKPDYKINFGKGVLEALQAEKATDLDVYVLVTIPPGHPEKMTANLMGPLVINQKARLAEQLIIEDERYSHKHPLVAPKK